ncbi:hypothetical protein Goklo_029121 [Gossypium klotzschianum]|uniref:Uncharacterized protein n=1 Tax=Gossypium klotzschianum TaxID=34286 RepID=A0A7J8WA22_9ROSI|nr:hypothetical protein [Gossypium klotzschianum]
MMIILVQTDLKKNIEVQIDDEDQIMLLSCSLPPSYKSFRETGLWQRQNLVRGCKGSFFE